MEEKTYKCIKCGKLKKESGRPECCGRQMTVVKLRPCTSVSAEHSRPMDEEEACDDSRGG